MRVHKIKIKNFKGIEDFENDFQGKSVMLIGENALGKSSIMQWIRLALGDQSAIPPQATGEGIVVADSKGQEYTFSVKFKQGKPTITITSPQGLKDDRKSALFQICGAHSFDVDSFVRMSETEKGRKEQVEIFKSFLPQDVVEELAKFENNARIAFEERTELNRDIKSLDIRIKSHRLYNFQHQLDTYKPVDVEDLTKRKEIERGNLNAIYKKNKAHNETLRASFEELKKTHRYDINQFNSKQHHASQLYDRCFEALQTLKECGYKGLEATEWLSSLPTALPNKEYDESKLPQPKFIEELPDDSELKTIDERIAKAVSINKEYTDAQELKKMLKDLVTYVEDSGNLTVKIDAGRQAIADTIRQMDSPVDGLVFDDNNLIFNGIPFAQGSLSTSELMEIGYKLKLKENPEGPLFIERTESMGKAKYEALLEFGKRNGVQLIMEEVVRGVESLKIELVGE